MRPHEFPTIAVLGGGQLARMIALAGVPLGCRFRVLDPEAAAGAGHCAELVVGAYDDPAAHARLVAGCTALTYEFENVPVATAEALQRVLPVAPPPMALAVSQDRVAEKTFLNRLGIATAPWRAVDDRAGFDAAVRDLGLPAVLKTRRLGYDGKGQAVVRSAADIEAAWTALGAPPLAAGRPADLILEGFVAFQRECSLIGVRGRDGATAFYPLAENTHRGGVLRLSLAPGPGLDAGMQADAEAAMARVLAELDYVGVLTIEFFVYDGRLIGNEMAPRVHNSGHWTIEGAVCSQFENHVRAVAGLPLGSTAVRGHAAMVNLIGDLPDPAAVARLPGVHLHRYGKQPRAGRKVGHITLVEADRATLDRRLAELTAIPGVV
jgi:5-(carboxyamino)imidazole ribonucleotide synthase